MLVVSCGVVGFAGGEDICDLGPIARVGFDPLGADSPYHRRHRRPDCLYLQNLRDLCVHGRHHTSRMSVVVV